MNAKRGTHQGWGETAARFMLAAAIIAAVLWALASGEGAHEGSVLAQLIR
jgi:hypothetical protein